MKKFILTLLLPLIFSCSSEVDNSEPPAPLVDFKPSAELKNIRQMKIGKGLGEQYLKLQPLVIDGRIVITDRKGKVQAINTKTGKVIWKKKNDLIPSSDIGGNKNLYLLGTRDGEVIALSPEDGRIVWRVRVSSEVLATPVLSDNTVVVRSTDGQVTALDAVNGKQKWLFKRDVPVLSLRGNSAPLVVDDNVFVGLDNGRLVVLSLKDGRLLWDKTIAIPRGRSEFERLVDIDANAIIKENVLYVSSYQGRVAALEISAGDFLWLRDMSVFNSLTIAEDRLYISDERSHIWALDISTGATIWKQEAFTARKLTAPVVIGDYLAVADFEGYVHLISVADGHMVANIQPDEEGIITTPVVSDNKLFVISRSGYLYTLKVK